MVALDSGAKLREKIKLRRSEGTNAEPAITRVRTPPHASSHRTRRRACGKRPLSSGGGTAERSAKGPQERIRGAAYRSSSSSMASLGAAMERRVAAAAARGSSRGGAGSPRHGCCGQRALRSPRGGIARTLPPPAGPCPLAGGLDAATTAASTTHTRNTDFVVFVPGQLSSPATTACRASGSLTPTNRLPFSGREQRALPLTLACSREKGGRTCPTLFFCEGRRKCRGAPTPNKQEQER
ncbi:hypothetical protein HPB50_016535 [Hyalomma asiaticum]|uniref:Uncharacterized protein n=1 Tax=Hyalomma asiaticum TaxID=266040 RepID=A0ACB7SZ93_HYAAI|nr:hypothetical protein HPB50_016535 [Hyalomma asiaticum]